MPPSKGWRVASIAYFVAMVVTAPIYCGVMGLSLVLAPVWLVLIWCVGVAARRAAMWRCPVCKSEMSSPAPAEREREDVTARGGGLQPAAG